MFHKRKGKIVSVADGEIIPLSQVSDPVFSSKIMGDGFAVRLQDNKIYSPVKGRVASIFPTKHALILTDEQGNDILIHIGIDTVELDGAGFDVKVNQNDDIEIGTVLVELELDRLRQELKKDMTTMVVLTDTNKNVVVQTGSLKHGEVVATFK